MRLARLPLKPPIPKSSSIRLHGGTPAREDNGMLLPLAQPPCKRQRRAPAARTLFPPIPSPASHPPLPLHAPRTHVLNITKTDPLLTTPQKDELSKYILADSLVLQSSGFDKLVNMRRGASDFNPNVRKIPHKSARYLDHLHKRGANVVLQTPPWNLERLEATLKQGPHKSSEQHAAFLREELLDFVQKGFWTILPWRLVKKYKRLLRLLRISPMGVVPQRSRRPRLIVDYSCFDLNRETLKLAPHEAMQFGKALERILAQIVSANPSHGPVKLIKVDIADGFYRVWLNLSDIPKLAVSIPSLRGEEPLLAFPLVLPMGWTESPPYFCSATETVTDVANRRAINNWKPPTHRLDAISDSPPVQDCHGPPSPKSPSATTAVPKDAPHRLFKQRLLSRFDVFVDDFIGMGQGTTKQLNNLRRILFHTLDEVFRPLDSADRPSRKEPASTKKLAQGDAHWTTRKVILGWIVDTLQMTIELPQHRLHRLTELLQSVPPTQKRISLLKWQQLLGELRSMSLAIPGSRGLFSLLHEALRHQDPSARLRLSQGVHDCLDDFRWLSNDLATRPTRLYEIVPQTHPELLGAQDACGYGMGGVWFPTTSRLHHRPQFPSAANEAPVDNDECSPLASSGNARPILWRARFEPDIIQNLVSFNNPSGTVTNSDLELAATIVQHDIAATNFDVRERTIATGCDNTPAVAWQRKGATSTSSPPAYLLRLQALHQRFHRYCSSVFYLPGAVNVMADDASRLFHLSDTQILTHFNSTYPQTNSWSLRHPTNVMLSSVTSALRKKRVAPASFLRAPTPTITPGSSGQNSAPISTLTPGSLMWGTQFCSSKSLAKGIVPDTSLPVTSLSSLAPWKEPCVQWGRLSPAWGPLTLA
jgi:hypothetical protein